MLRGRVKELLDFATTESPYRSANKGWVTDDVYLQWGSSLNQDSNEGDELANVSVFWKPIIEIALILFVVVALATIFVFSAVSISHGRFQISLGNFPVQSTSELIQAENGVSVESKISNVVLPSEEEPAEPQRISEDLGLITDSPSYSGAQTPKGAPTTMDMLFQPAKPL